MSGWQRVRWGATGKMPFDLKEDPSSCALGSLPHQGPSAHGTSSFSFRAGDNREAGSHRARTDVGTLRGERNPKEASLLFSAGWR